MEAVIINESGFANSLMGCGLSFGLISQRKIGTGITPEMLNKLKEIALKLYDKDGGHNKLLEGIQVWIDIRAPRYWWSEMDTYRVGCTKQSESTIHTLMKNPITQEMFEKPIWPLYIDFLESLRKGGDLTAMKNALPEGFLQRRIMNTNYKTLRNILSQRKNHKLQEWRDFCLYIYRNVDHPEFFKDIMNP